MNNKIKKFLDIYFGIFEAKLTRLIILDTYIKGELLWLDGESESFKINHLLDSIDLELLMLIINHIKDNKLIDIDRIIISFEDLLTELSSYGYKRSFISRHINYLTNFEVEIIENNIKMDALYLHF